MLPRTIILSCERLVKWTLQVKTYISIFDLISRMSVIDSYDYTLLYMYIRIM